MLHILMLNQRTRTRLIPFLESRQEITATIRVHLWRMYLNNVKFLFNCTQLILLQINLFLQLLIEKQLRFLPNWNGLTYRACNNRLCINTN